MVFNESEFSCLSETNKVAGYKSSSTNPAGTLESRIQVEISHTLVTHSRRVLDVNQQGDRSGSEPTEDNQQGTAQDVVANRNAYQ